MTILKDNYVVTLITYKHGVLPAGKVQRYSRAEKKKMMSTNLMLSKATMHSWGELTRWTTMYPTKVKTPIAVTAP